MRVNIIDPLFLTDQHLLAEYREILLLLGHVKKHPKLNNIPENYTLGTGHINFFKNKILYLKNRHDLLVKELLKRKYNIKLEANINDFEDKYINDWKPRDKDFDIILERIKNKIYMKPEFYTYYREHKSLDFFDNLIKRCLRSSVG